MGLYHKLQDPGGWSPIQTLPLLSASAAYPDAWVIITKENTWKKVTFELYITIRLKYQNAKCEGSLMWEDNESIGIWQKSQNISQNTSDWLHLFVQPTNK